MTNLFEKIQDRFGTQVNNCSLGKDNTVTLEMSTANLLSICHALHDDEPFKFDQLIDLAGVDYLTYGQPQWRTEETTASGFSRGAKLAPDEQIINWDKPRFGAVYQLLSTSYNQRLRLKVLVDGDPPLIPSVYQVWNSADWYEREAFDLYGIIFDGHPDLRRLLTDYGFIGHPFRKDFPLIGEVELRYDAAQQRCVYEPVSIQQRVLVPKVIRKDSRYLSEEA